MKIREYVAGVANLLSLWDATKIDENILANNDPLTVERIDKLCSIVNGIIHEIARYFVPLILQKQVKTSDGVVPFSQLKANIVNIEKVVDDKGNEIGFTTYYDRIKMDKPSGTIYYRILPISYNYGNEIHFTDFQVPRKVIIYGAAAEFCLAEGLFDEAVAWHEKYREQIKLLTKPKNLKIKKRTWA